MQGHTPQTHFFVLFRCNFALQSAYLFNIEFAWLRNMYSLSPVNIEVTLWLRGINDKFTAGFG